ncbi:(2E,6E)-farnesyl diphosphate synthase [Neiella marina]|uniref:(2E,6E)-farnesyl diphosphate synthase n=1 Tax=Neiella holothuriorum TaxID=2870530 RepID=A0ABS7EHN1_9GAMM|nr:(2E,6E)-farnesyl diphosphate synthase [Neiella holothuriorum]MBW8191805.1 (2E,6E)-farnesyl diphosphate synthase [Neiella holothuriorum]
MTNLSQSQAAYQQRINHFLRDVIDQLPTQSNTLKAAMAHGLLLGGKRARPFLVYATADMLGVPLEQVDNPAAAIECIHAYSLIHDDLPAMDDDELRRGQPTCHIAFDEATAILAGDALQTLAFELLSETNSDLAPAIQLQLVQSLAQASGYRGMCGGQALDLAATDKVVDLVQLEQIHLAKTGALLRCAVDMSAIIANVDAQQRQTLQQFATAIGLAFQVQDDILDVTSDTETLGKPQGSDEAANKSTYPALLGLSGARQKADSLLKSALQALQTLPYNSQQLEVFAHYIVDRKY